MPRTLIVVLGGVWLSATEAAAQEVVSLSPSGGDDTAALQAAFDAAVAAGPGSTVSLAAGTYCLTSPVVVRGFSGSWVGAGQGETVVTTCTGTDPFPVPAYIQPDPAYPDDPPLELISPLAFLEVEGAPSLDVRISDLTLHLQGETHPWYAHGLPDPLTLFRPGILVAGGRGSVVDGEISTVAFAVDRFELLGSPAGLVFGQASYTNIDNGIIVRGGLLGDIDEVLDLEPIQASVSVTRSHFERVAFSGVQTPICTGCDLTIGGSQSQGNTWSAHYGALLFGDSVGAPSEVVVSHNRGQAQFGAIVWTGVPRRFVSTPLPAPTGPSRLEVSHNRIDIFAAPINPTWACFIGDRMYGLDGVQGLETSITDNTFGVTDLGFGAAALAGIYAIEGKDTVIWNNKISGDYALAGIMAGPFAAENLSIVGNNLSDVTAGFAPIWLGPRSESTHVVGGRNGGSVVDLGSGNVITGVNVEAGSTPGPELLETLQGFYR